MLNLTRSEAIRLFEALGSKTADKWGRKQMTEKIKRVDEMVDTETNITDPDVNKILDSVLTAIEDGEEIIVTKEPIQITEKTVPEPPDKSLPEKKYSVYVHPESDRIFIDIDGQEYDGLTHAEVSGLSKEEANRQLEIIKENYFSKNKEKEDSLSEIKSEDENEDPDPPKNIKVEKPASVRILKSRSYYAGVVIRKHGISVGITEEMVNEVDKLCKKRNRNESMYRLRLAWHAVYGFCGLETN